MKNNNAVKTSIIKDAFEKIEKLIESLDKDQSEMIFIQDLKEKTNGNASFESDLQRQKEFCFEIIFSPDKIKNPDLIKTCRDFINLVDLD
jgi:hypothetical protein